MNHWQGKWALITGASAGIGVALARELAAGGTNLVLTARRRDRLAGLAAELSSKHDIRTLSAWRIWRSRWGRNRFFRSPKRKNIAIDLLVNNAGFGAYGEFHKAPLETLVEMTQVNVTAVVHMTHLYLPGMIARRGGDILILASTAAFQAVPYISTYAATKVFDLHFAEGIGGRSAAVRRARLRAVSRLDGDGIFPGGRPAKPHAARSGDAGKSRARGPGGAGCRKNVR